ncbi:hypothetical protein SDC9_131119 [bioreactor metagenome]|uniref:Uncharacterized protein n=1 Tax=bioreactor metagenome TaxID=1076179 RepID=A0A645D4Q5_9ZZZZ
MHVSCRHDRLVFLRREPDYRFIVFYELFSAFLAVTVYKEIIVWQRLDLEIVVIIGDFKQIAIAPVFNDGAEKLAGFTGRADNKTVAVFAQHCFRYARMLSVIFKIRI